jgi:hypothetical protein
MSDNEVDPARNTQQFQAFVQKGESGSVQQPGPPIGLIIGIVAVIVVVIAAAVYFLL